MEPTELYYTAFMQAQTEFYQHYLQFQESRCQNKATFFHNLSFLTRYEFESYIETKTEVNLEHH